MGGGISIPRIKPDRWALRRDRSRPVRPPAAGFVRHSGGCRNPEQTRLSGKIATVGTGPRACPEEGQLQEPDIPKESSDYGSQIGQAQGPAPTISKRLRRTRFPHRLRQHQCEGGEVTGLVQPVQRREKAVAECYALGDRPTQSVKEEIAVDNITLKNFRCFRGEQTARLAPLTLLVGENSTGKTSFMTMIRVLCDVLYGGRAPDFKEEPYDLGSFDEIAHYRGGKGGRADSFEAGFQATFETVQKRRRRSKAKGQTYRFEATFEKNGSAPVLGKARLCRKDVWIEASRNNQSWETSFGTSKGAWRVSKTSLIHLGADQDSLPFFHSFLWRVGLGSFELKKGAEQITSQGPKQPTTNDLERIEQLAEIPGRIGLFFTGEQPYTSERPFAGGACSLKATQNLRSRTPDAGPRRRLHPDVFRPFVLP